MNSKSLFVNGLRLRSEPRLKPAALVLLAQLASLGFVRAPRSRVRKQFAWTVSSLLLGVPQLLFMLRNRNHQLTWVQHPSAKDVYHFFLHLTGSGLSSLVYLVAFALAFRQLWLRLRSPRQELAAAQEEGQNAWPYIFASLWLFVPVLIAMLASHWKPVFVPRFLLVCLPASVLLGAAGLASITKAWVRNGVVVILALASVVGVRSYYRHPPVQDWRGAVAYITQNAAPGDAVLFPFAHYSMPFGYYNDRLNAPALRVAVLPAPSALIGDSQHVWLVLSDPPGPPVNAAMIQLAPLYREESATDFQGIKLIEFTARKP